MVMAEILRMCWDKRKPACVEFCKFVQTPVLVNYLIFCQYVEMFVPT
jgi:hypothetical protein